MGGHSRGLPGIPRLCRGAWPSLQIEGKILAPIPVNKKQRRKKLAGKYLWPDVPGNPARLRWVYLAGKGWLAPTVLERSTLPCCPWCSRCGRTASRTKATTAPLELEPWEFRLLARRTLERLEQKYDKM